MPEPIDHTNDFPRLHICACCPEEDAEDCMAVFMGAWVCLGCKNDLENSFAEQYAADGEYRYGYE